MHGSMRSHILFLRLLSSESDLCSHNPLSLCNQGALCTGAISPSAVPLVPFQPRNCAMIPATGTFGHSLWFWFRVGVLDDERWLTHFATLEVLKPHLKVSEACLKVVVCRQQLLSRYCPKQQSFCYCSFWQSYLSNGYDWLNKKCFSYCCHSLVNSDKQRIFDELKWHGLKNFDKFSTFWKFLFPFRFSRCERARLRARR